MNNTAFNQWPLNSAFNPQYQHLQMWSQNSVSMGISGVGSVPNRAEVAELKLKLQLEVEVKTQLAFQLQTFIGINKQLLTDKQRLIRENRKRLQEKNKLVEKISKQETELQQKEQLVAANQKLLEEKDKLMDELKAINDDLKELTNLKLKCSMLIEERNKLKLDLDSRIANAKALSAVNEMLLKGNEKRDEIISQYKKERLKNGKYNTSSDNDSMQECVSPVPATSTPVASKSLDMGQQRRIGCKALHALSTLGAENTLGPWLCLTCGNFDTPIKFVSYAEYRQHLINVHKEAIDPAICVHCGWRSRSDRDLHFHMYKIHQIDTPFYTFSKSAMLDKFEKDTSEIV